MTYKDYIKYRSVWMGAAILWIILFHLHLPGDSFFVTKICNLGYAGSDIFYFASGLGIWFSLQHTPDVKTFYKKRAHRILPMYWCFIVVWLGFRFWICEMTIPMAVGNLLGIQVLFGLDGAFNWYITYLLLFYLLAPLIRLLYLKLKQDRLCMLFLAVLFLVLFLTCHVSQLTIGLSRLPVFSLGMLFGKMTEEKNEISLPQTVVMLCLLPVGLGLALYFGADVLRGWYTGLMWYPLILSVPGTCMVLSLLGRSTEKFRPAKKGVLPFLGEHTMELYYVHIFVLEVYEKVFLLRMGNTFSYLHLPVLAAIIALLSRLLKKITDLIKPL